MNKGPLFFVEHILENIKDIELFVRGLTKVKFLKDKKTQNAIIRSIEVIGEATKNLPMDFNTRFPKVEWAKITGTRDKLIHHYFGVSLEMVWIVITNDLPILKEQMEMIKAELINSNISEGGNNHAKQ